MSAPRIFDRQHYDALNSSRGARVSQIISELKEPLGLRTAVDVGCGLGHFSGLLKSFGLDVLGVDGRQENVEEAQRRFPQIPFRICNAQESALRDLGRFDLVFCFGLLYHLENPLIAIRQLCAMTAKLLLVESVIFPGDEPIMALVDEGKTEDQGLNHIAFYPTEACLIKMLYRSGYSHVYVFNVPPDHSEYRSGAYARRTRTMLAASANPLLSNLLRPLAEPNTHIAPWDPTSGVPQSRALQRLRTLMGQSLPRKLKSMGKRVKE
ncbi:MAG: class I SAM-dependent methyltransferase [Candidatus Acidiferrum sp.]